MRRIRIAFIASGILGLVGVGCVQAETWRHQTHFHLPAVYESRGKLSIGTHGKEMSFEALRMLSTGMTKAEVLNRVGSPRHSFKNRGTQRWVYSAPDNWIVEIVFSGNNVIAINWSRA